MWEMRLEGKLGQSCRALNARLKSSYLPPGVSEGEEQAQITSQKTLFGHTSSLSHISPRRTGL